jgi:hypothetical protein
VTLVEFSIGVSLSSLLNTVITDQRVLSLDRETHSQLFERRSCQTHTLFVSLFTRQMTPDGIALQTLAAKKTGITQDSRFGTTQRSTTLSGEYPRRDRISTGLQRS